MKHFRKIINKKTKGLKHKYSDKIVMLFDRISTEYIFEKRNARKPNSNAIKYNMVKLGHELGYRVYANGLTETQKIEQYEKHKFVNREFLYDIHWYTDRQNEYYSPEKVSLVAESELGDRRKGDESKLKNPAVMFDFQKLLIANAELRLLIFKVRNQQELEALDYYFEKSIQSYSLLRKKSVFLFICFSHDSREMYYAEKYKN